MSRVQSGQYLDLPNGIRLHFASAGDKSHPLLLFVHGFPEAWFAWERQLETFGTDYYAVALDLRGFNLSAKPRDVEAYRVRHLVEDLNLAIAALGYSEARVVAHDWGGAVAWNLAIFTPRNLAKLVIVNAPHPVIFMRRLAHDPDQQKASAYMNWLRQPGAEEELSAYDFKRLDALFGGRWYDAPTRARYHAMWSVPGEGGSHGMTGGLNYYRASPLHPSADGAAPSIRDSEWVTRVPVRVIWGMRDTALLPGLLDGLPEFCPDLKVTRVPDASHWIVHEQPDLIDRLIAEALAD